MKTKLYRSKGQDCPDNEQSEETVNYDELAAMINGCQQDSGFDDPGLLDYYVNLTNRVILLSEMLDKYPTDNNTSNYTHETSLILRWNIEDEADNIPIEERTPIKILIDCPGGDVSVMFKIINMIDASRTPVYTVNLQSADSAAGIILMSGHPGRRYCMKYSSVLVHDGSMGASGSNGSGFESTVDYVRKTQDLGDEIIMNRTKISKKIMSSWKGKEKYLFADEQLKYGIVDHILNNFSEIFWSPKYFDQESESGKDYAKKKENEDIMNPPEGKKEN